MLRLKELRLENALTQRELAAKIRTTDKSIWAYEKGIAVPPLDVLIKLGDFFECSIDYLAGRSDDFGNVIIPGEYSSPQLSDEEQRLIDTYRALNAKNRLHVSTYAEIRLEEQGGAPTPERANWKK